MEKGWLQIMENSRLGTRQSEPRTANGDNSERTRISRSSAAFLSLQSTLLKGQRARPMPNSSPHHSAQSHSHSHGSGHAEADDKRGPRRRETPICSSSPSSSERSPPTLSRVYHQEERNIDGTSSTPNTKAKKDHSDWESGRNHFQSLSNGICGRAAGPSSVASVREAYESFENGDISLDKAVDVIASVGKNINDDLEWANIVNQFLFHFAIESGEIFIDMAVRVCVKCIQHVSFQEAVFSALMGNLGQLMMEGSHFSHKEGENLCELMGKLLVTKWPRIFDSSRKETNEILYGILSAVYGWLDVLEDEAQKESLNRAESSLREAEICAEALTCLCGGTGRQLWLRWPDLVDRIYSVLRHFIVSPFNKLQEHTRCGLLDLYVAVNGWPGTNRRAVGFCGTPPRPPMVPKQTQTEPQTEGGDETMPTPDTTHLHLVSQSLAQMRIPGVAEPMEDSSIGHSARQLTVDEAERLLADKETLSTFKQEKLEKEARKNWDKFYLRNETNFFKDRHWTAQEFVSLCPDLDFNSSIRILEVGCGVGNFLFPFLEAFPSISACACDFSARAVNLVKENPLYSSKRVSAFVCDVTEDSAFGSHVPDSSMDVCTLIFVLSAIHPTKMGTVAENIRKALKVGGSVIVRDYGLYDHAMLRFHKGHKIMENFYVRQDGTRAYYFSTEGLKSLFEECSYQTVSCEYVKKDTTNKKEGISVPRIFIQARFRRPFVGSIHNMEESHAVENARHDWYQTESDVVVAVMIKGASKEGCRVSYGDKGHLVDLSLLNEETGEWEERLRLPLFRYIHPSHSSFRCFNSKIEIKLRKAEGGRWERLESATGTPQGAQALPSHSVQDTCPGQEGAPKYPTSSTKGPKNWDKIEKEAVEEDEKEEKSGDAAVNRLFQQIYRDADDDVKKAMMKSFQESNGTVLSTNWNEVGKDKVDCKPPDGMEFKKY